MNEVIEIDSLENEKNKLTKEIKELKDLNKELKERINNESWKLEKIKQEKSSLEYNFDNYKNKQILDFKIEKDNFKKQIETIKENLNTDFVLKFISNPLFIGILNYVESFKENSNVNLKLTQDNFDFIKYVSKQLENNLLVQNSDIQNIINIYDKIKQDGDEINVIKIESEKILKELNSFMVTKQNSLKEKEKELERKTLILEKERQKIENEKIKIKSDWSSIFAAKKEFDLLKNQ